MAATIVLTLVYLVGGILAASVWGAILRMFGEGCAAPYEWGGRHRRLSVCMTTFTVALVFQVYGALTFVALVVSVTQHFLAVNRDVWEWPIWISACLVAEWPVLVLVKSASRMEERCPVHMIAMGLVPVALLAFFAFFFRQSLLEAGWWWLPYATS
ncbi:MAG: hypothetical protein LLG20_21870 [Acidobacteriales bacterium]|nr:hypothetical protein [Terriglobales bacterium]